jgi:uncharacterized membrane-anchored protein
VFKSQILVGRSTGRSAGFAPLSIFTLIFWLIKIAATTLGETAGDAVPMSACFCLLSANFDFVAVQGFVFRFVWNTRMTFSNLGR